MSVEAKQLISRNMEVWAGSVWAGSVSSGSVSSMLVRRERLHLEIFSVDNWIRGWLAGQRYFGVRFLFVTRGTSCQNTIGDLDL